MQQPLSLSTLPAASRACCWVAGAWTWLIARIVYIPLYLAGVPYIRSLAWLVSVVGLVVMMATLLF